MRKFDKVELLIGSVVLAGLLVGGWITVANMNRVTSLSTQAAAHGCEIEFDRRIICAEHIDPALHGCASGDTLLENITCKDGRKAVYTLNKHNGSTWSWKK